MTYEERLAKLVKASKRLSHDHKAQGRNNSRTAVLEALRECRKALDADYPRRRKKQRKRRHPETLMSMLKKQGYIKLNRCRNPTHVADVANSVGVAIRKVVAVDGRDTHWVPLWLEEACFADIGFPKIRELVRSPNAREVFMAQVRLEASAHAQARRSAK